MLTRIHMQSAHNAIMLQTCTHNYWTELHKKHDLQSNSDDETVFQHLPAVMGVIMRTWHLLDIKKHIILSSLSPVYFLTVSWSMFYDGVKESLIFLFI